MKSGPTLLSPVWSCTSVVVAFTFHEACQLWTEKYYTLGCFLHSFSQLPVQQTSGKEHTTVWTDSVYSSVFCWTVLQIFGRKIPHTTRSNSETGLAFCWVRLETCWLSVFWVRGRNRTNKRKENLQANQYLGFPDSQSWNIVENEGPDGTSDAPFG